MKIAIIGAELIPFSIHGLRSKRGGPTAAPMVFSRSQAVI